MNESRSHLCVTIVVDSLTMISRVEEMNMADNSKQIQLANSFFLFFESTTTESSVREFLYFRNQRSAFN